MQGAAREPRQGRRRRRLVFVAVGVLAAAGMLAAALGGAALGRADRLLDRASWALARDVTADGVSVTLFGGPAVAVTGLRIAEDPALGSATPFVTADRLVMRLDVPALLARRLLVNRIVLDTPVVHLAHDASGRLNVASLGRNLARHAGHPIPPSVHGPRRGFALGRLGLRHATIEYTPTPGAPAYTMTDVTVDAHAPRFGALVPMTASGRLDGDGVVGQGLSTEGVLDLTGAEPAFRGRVRTARGTLGPIAFTGLAARVALSSSAVEVHAATLQMLGGNARVEVKLVGAGEDAGLTGHVDAAALDVSQLAWPDAGALGGIVEIHADVTGPPLGREDVRSGFGGHGSLVMANGTLPVRLGAVVLDELQPVLGDPKSDRLRERYADLFGGDLRFAHLTASLTLADGTLRSDDLAATSASYDARGSGTVGRDGRLAFTLEVTASPALTTEIVGRGRTRAALLGDGDRLVIPLRVQGTVQHPHVSPTPEFSARVARALIGGDLGERAGDLLERLLRPHKHKGI